MKIYQEIVLLGNKTSDIVGNLNYSPNDIFKA